MRHPVSIARASAGALAIAALVVAAAPRAAAQQDVPPVDVRVEGVFGSDALLGDGYATIVVTARNITRETFRGRLLVVAHEYGQAEERHALSLDLPGGEARRVVTTLFVGGNGPNIEARYEVDGSVLGLHSVAAAYAPGGRSLVLLSDPPRLRASLLDLQVTVPDPTAVPSYGATATGAERAVTIPIGLVSLDPATGDPILPDESLGWSSVAVAVASTAMLARAPRRELDAMLDWVHAGGHLVIAPRTAADLRAPIVRELVGDVSTSDRPLPPGDFLALEPIVPALECGERASTERFGCAAAVGFGTVYVLAFDVTAPPFSEAPQARTLVRSIAQRALRSPGPRLGFGRTRDTFSQESWVYTASFSRLRAALDPNEGYRPALGLVAIVLFLYVLVVGPLNFRFVLGRNAPTLALVTTPVAAFACALVMLTVGYVGKGVLTRSRRVEIVEAVEGSALAPARGYTGLFVTRPTTVESATPARGLTMRLSQDGGDDGLLVTHGGDRPRLTNLRAGLWETLFLRTDRMIDLGGAPVFQYEGQHLVALTNHTGTTLRSAFVLDEGQVYAIGDVAPGATRPIPRTPAGYVSTTAYYDDASDPAPGQVALHLGLDPEDDVPYVRGVLRLFGPQFSSPGEPLLWARIDPDDPPETSPGFAREHDLRVLVMHPRRGYELLGVAAAPLPAGGTWAEPQQAVDTSLPEIDPATDDAGVPDGGEP